MKKLIGIISYLPDNILVRNARLKKLVVLLEKCRELFNLPVVIIAQNWKTTSFDFPDVEILHYDQPLGITGARRELRKIFLQKDYDYLIMLDDDCELVGSSGEKYLRQIDGNPDCFIEFNKTLLKLFAISKKIFSELDYDDVSPEKEEGFEDRIFVNRLRNRFPSHRRTFQNTDIEQHSNSTGDELSTWYCNQNLQKMLENTRKIIEEDLK